MTITMKINHVVQSNPWIYSSGFFLLILSTAMGCKTHISPSQSMENSKTENTSNSTHGIQNVMLPSNTYCRAIVNTKDGYSTWVTFDKDKIDVTRHWGGIMNIEGEWVQIVKMSYLGKEKIYDLLFLKNLYDGRYSYIDSYRTLLNDNSNNTYTRYCFSYVFYHYLNKWGRWEQNYADPNIFTHMNETQLLKHEYEIYCENEAEEGVVQTKSDELRGLYCEMYLSWMVFMNHPKYEFICESTSLSARINILETVGSMITVFHDVDIQTCASPSPNLSNLDTIAIQKKNVDSGTLYFGTRSFDLYSTSEYKEQYLKYINSDRNHYIPHGIFLFTHGATQRRSIGVIKEWRNGDEPNRVELPELPEKMKSMLKDIDRAPDGCGYFDWETADLVNQSGRRYHVADYEDIAGIYWLKPEDSIDISKLDLEPKAPVVVEQDYTPPSPLPNCEFFTQDFQERRKLDKLARKCGCNRRFVSNPFDDLSDCTDEAYEWYKKYYFDLYDGSNIEDDDDPSEEECEECDSFYDEEP